MKRFYILCLIFILIIFTCNVNAFATNSSEYIFEKDGINYKVISDKYVKVVANSFTKGCEGVISIPEKVLINNTYYNVVEIGNSAFAGRGLITEVNLPSSIKSIEESAFFSCCSLNNINIPNNVENIDNFAFYDCSSLKEINIPCSTKNIGEHVFGLCTNLERINVSNDNDNYLSNNGVLINKTNNTLISCPANKLGEYEIPDFIKKIGNSAFAYSKLEKINIYKNVNEIDMYAFFNCKNLHEIKLPDNLKYIGDYAFYKCSALKEIKVPDSILNIGKGMFLECFSLEKILLPSDINNIEYGAFGGCFNLKNIVLNPNNNYYCIDDDVLYTKNKSILVCCPAQKSGSYTISDCATEIADYAFAGTLKLEKIVIGNNIKCIGKYSFCNSYIKKVDLPDSVENIKEGAFISCHNLEEVNILYNVSSICKWSFWDCENLKNVTILSKGINLEGDRIFKKSDKLVVHGLKESTMENYCIKNSIAFLAV